MRHLMVLPALALIFVASGSPASRAPSPVAAAASDVLMLKASTGDHFPDWIDSSNPDYDEESDDPGVSPVYRIRGDAYSPYYYFRRGANRDEFRTDDGRLLARVNRYSTLLGIRKSSDRMAVYLYHVRTAKMADYHIVLIARGAARVWHCSIGLALFNTVLGKNFTDEAEAATRGGPQNALVDLLEGAEPALARDHCRAVATSVSAREAGVRRPLLDIAFPKPGDWMKIDQQGLRGGWLYAGVSAYGRADKDCCLIEFRGDRRNMFLITGRSTPAGTARSNSVKVRRIVYYDPAQRSAFGCMLDGRRTMLAIGDAGWTRGTAYLDTAGTVTARDWTSGALSDCRAP